jgi:hypothetical protein
MQARHQYCDCQCIEGKCDIWCKSTWIPWKKICGLSVPPTESARAITPLSYLWTCAPLVDLMSLDAFDRLWMYISKHSTLWECIKCFSYRRTGLDLPLLKTHHTQFLPESATGAWAKPALGVSGRPNFWFHMRSTHARKRVKRVRVVNFQVKHLLISPENEHICWGSKTAAMKALTVQTDQD